MTCALRREDKEEGAMACENCRYWDAVYAPYIHKMIMACTKEGKESSMGTCKYFKRKLPDFKHKGEAPDDEQ